MGLGMPLPEELLDLARQISDLDQQNQAGLRRAVSTAYYGLFHLLVTEATANWSRAELRPLLGRFFEHGSMRSASSVLAAEHNKLMKTDPPESAELTVAKRLNIVATTFAQAQQARNTADYDVAALLNHDEVLQQIASVSTAFESWKAVRDEPVAQSFLVSMLARKR